MQRYTACDSEDSETGGPDWILPWMATECGTGDSGIDVVCNSLEARDFEMKIMNHGHIIDFNIVIAALV